MMDKVEKGKRLNASESKQLTAEVVRGYTELGMSIRALSEHTGRAYGTVHRMLCLAGVPLRGRGGKRQQNRSGVS
jgi:hypothetical protein